MVAAPASAATAVCVDNDADVDGSISMSSSEADVRSFLNDLASLSELFGSLSFGSLLQLGLSLFLFAFS